MSRQGVNFIRVENEGVPTYYCMGLEDLCEYGGANADGIKQAHEKVFSSIPRDIYTSGKTSAAADGASVNFGRWEGFLAKLTEEGRPWLIQHMVLTTEQN